MVVKKDEIVEDVSTGTVPTEVVAANAAATETAVEPVEGAVGAPPEGVAAAAGAATAPLAEVSEAATETAVDTAPPEEVAAAATEETPKFSESFRNRIKGDSPDEFADDEAFFQKATEQLDNLEGYRNKNIEANKALKDIFDAEPIVTEVLKDMIKGSSFRSAIARHFSPEDLTPGEGAEDEEEYKTNLSARGKRLKDDEDYKTRKVEAEEFSIKEIKAFAEETNLSEEQATEFLATVGEALEEVYAGKISKKFLSSMYKALNHEGDVKNATETGRITGRNEKIEVEKEKGPKGDGTPIITGSSSPVTEPKKKDWFDNLAEKEKKRNIL